MGRLAKLTPPPATHALNAPNAPTRNASAPVGVVTLVGPITPGCCGERRDCLRSHPLTSAASSATATHRECFMSCLILVSSFAVILMRAKRVGGSALPTAL